MGLAQRCRDELCSRLLRRSGRCQAAFQVGAENYRVVDDEHQRSGETADDHEVHRLAGKVKSESSGDDRDRDGDGGDEGRAPVEQSPHQHQENEGCRDDHDDGQVVDRRHDVVGGPIELRVDLDSLEAGGHCRQSGFDAVGDVEGAGIRPFLDYQNEPGAALEQGIADQRLVILDNSRHVGKTKLRPAFKGDLTQIFRALDGRDVVDADTLVGRVDKAAGAGDGRLDEAQGRRPERVGSRLDDIDQGNLLFLHPIGIGEDLELLLALAPDRNIGHPGDAHEPRPDVPARQDRHVDQGKVLRGEADHHGPRHGRTRLHHLGRLRSPRQRHHGFGEALLDHLACLEQLGPRLEDELDRGQARHRLGAQNVDKGNIAEEIGLERHGDHLGHLPRRKAERFTLDLDDDRTEFGVDVDCHLAELADAEEQHHGGERQDEQPKFKTPIDNTADY